MLLPPPLEEQVWKKAQQKLSNLTLQENAPELQFLASFQELPEGMFKALGEEALLSLLPFCKNLTLFHPPVWNLALAKQVALFGPKKLTLILPKEEEKRIISSLEQEEALPEEHLIALNCLQEFRRPISNPQVAFSSSKNLKRYALHSAAPTSILRRLP
ncbi:MAG: hypothetical protein JSR80_07040 [Verrucomicrobia bacterium]|nr:hypothetical protein [Verrucomicrobiota bacterium]